MPTILFFDDWMLQESRGLNRRWFSAEPWPGHEPYFDPRLEMSFCHPIVHRDPETKQWRMWATGSRDYTKGDEGLSVCLYISEDGIDWRPSQNKPLDRLASPELSHIVFSGEYSSHGSAVFYDEREPDPDRRYKVAYSEIRGANLLAPHANKIATSPDGVRWQIDQAAVWREHICDTFNDILFNPCTKQYQFTGRTVWGDRRIALYQTDDWKHFTSPMIILHPDPADPPGVEFYGMPQFYYEGYFIGFLWKMHGAFNDYQLSLRMKGRMSSELVYSINGLSWNRTNRQAFTPDYGIDREGFFCDQPACMIQDDDGWIRIYSTWGLGEHDEGVISTPTEQSNYLTINRLRQDGFCGLESHSEIGYLVLRPMLAHGGPITINATVARRGKIRAELRRVPDNTPIPGFELENSLAVQGDGHHIPLRWKNRQTTDAFIGEPFRVYLELDQARIYAVRMNADYLFAAVPQTNLAGDYKIIHQIPLPWFTPSRLSAYQ